LRFFCCSAAAAEEETRIFLTTPIGGRIQIPPILKAETSAVHEDDIQGAAAEGMGDGVLTESH
jgi:hypothetical protein